MSHPEAEEPRGGEAVFDALRSWLAGRFSEVFGPDAHDWSSIRVWESARPEFGDFQCNDAMALARSLRMAPRAIAEKVVAKARLPAMLREIEVAGPGFINLRVDDEWLAGRLAAMAADPFLGASRPGEGRTLILDYSSPNVAKPMHIGHIRSTVIGNALDRMYRELGYRVIADNHLGDWGTQFGILIMGYRKFADPRAIAERPVEELERVYVKSYECTRTDPEWLRACREELVKLQRGDAENVALWRRFVRWSMEAFEKIYRRLDVRFDIVRGESHYQPVLEDTVALLRERGLTEESEGALIVRLEAEGLPPSIVRKSDGGFNYTTTDIATVLERVREFHPERIVYVTDERQQLHFKQFFAICRRLDVDADLVHVWFGLMRLPEGTFSTRQGNVIKLDALLDEAERRALEIVKESSPAMPADEQRELARAIGIGAVKYADLSQTPQTLVVFSWEKALALDGNSAPYLQYAHARIRSVLEKYAERFPEGDPDAQPLRFREPIERTLAMKMLRYPTILSRAAQQYKPSILADYLYDLAQTYSSFYQQVPFLKAPEGVREVRVRLCGMVAAVLRKGLDLLGIAAPPRI